MAIAYVEVNSDVLAALSREPYRNQATLLTASDMGDGTFLAKVESERIPDDGPMWLELVLGPDEVRFKRACDT